MTDRGSTAIPFVSTGANDQWRKPQVIAIVNAGLNDQPRVTKQQNITITQTSESVELTDDEVQQLLDDKAADAFLEGE